MVYTQYADGSGAVITSEQYPIGSQDPLEGVPELVGKDRDEAWRSYYAGIFKGAALLGRAALELSVKLLGAPGSKLRAQIDNLADAGVITKKLAEWAHEVRATGNEAAHEMADVTLEDADAALAFLDSFLEDVYVMPHKHQLRQEARAARQQAEADETL